MLKYQIFDFLLLTSIFIGVGASPDYPDNRIANVIEKCAAYSKNTQLTQKIKQACYHALASIEQHKNAELNRLRTQREFNNHVLYEFIQEPFPVVLRNSDISNGLFVLIDLAIEFNLYHGIVNAWADLVDNYIMQHRQVFLTALEAIQENDLDKSIQPLKQLIDDMLGQDFIINLMRQLLPLITINLGMNYFSYRLKHYYLLDDPCSKNIITFLVGNLFGIKSLYTGLLEKANEDLKNSDQIFGVKLLPDWSNGHTFIITRNICFMWLFMCTNIKSFFQSVLLEVLVNNRKILLEPENKEICLKKNILQAHKLLFTKWLTLKSEKYAVWQTIINMGIIMPLLLNKLYDKN